ncbi:MAG: TRAP transporter large permease subunit [Spirochaetota bacterium]
MNPESIAPFLFVFLMVFVFMGFPVAFALGGSAIVFGYITNLLGYFDMYLLFALPERFYGIMENKILLAVPFFIFMGTLLEKSKLAEDLLKTIGMLFGPLRGGLAIAVILVGTLLAAATGVVGASVVAMGMISLPVMLRYKYSKSLASGVITASGTLGQIIPPSVVLVVLGDQMGVSVGDLFLAALIPGLLLAGFYILYVICFAVFSPESAPALPVEERAISLGALLGKCLFAMFPPLLLILFVLGGIFVGVTTPTEAGALGAMGALLLAAVHRRLNREMLQESLQATSHLTVMILFLLVGSTVFSLVFRGLNGDLWVQDALTNLPGGKFGLILLSNIVIFFLGFFIDFFEIVFIVIPLLVPAARVLGIDLVWFAVLMAMNLQTSFLTPPFGFSLFYLRGVAPPELKTKDMYRGVIPFLVIQIFTFALVLLFPKLLLTGM